MTKTKMTREIINDGLSIKPSRAEYEKLHGVTHHSFRVDLNPRTSCWEVTAIPYQDWEQRLEDEMKKYDPVA